MSPTLKKIIFIIVILAVAGLIGFGLYIMFKSAGIVPTAKAPTKKITTTTELPTAGERRPGAGAVVTPEAGQLPTAGIITPGTEPTPSYYRPEPVVKAVSDYAIYTSLNNNGTVRYHNGGDGKFYSLGTDGQIKALSDQTFYNVSKVTWAKNQDKAVIEYPDSSKIVYNFTTNKQTTLPKHWSDFSFSSDGSQIAGKSIGLSPENRWLVVTNDDGTGTKLIEPMGENADLVIVDWSPSRQVAAFSRTGQALGFDRQEILMVGLNHENFKAIIAEGLGFQPSWSPTGKKLLYSVYNSRSNYKPELWISSAYGDDIGANRQMLNINTWADKCAFSGDDTLFCAIPRSLPDGAGMSREVAAGTPDDLYKIDLKTGLKTPISLGDSDYSINNISFDAKTNKVIFTDANKTGIFEAKM